MATKRIKDLTATATQKDLISENYGVLDTSGVTKKVPGYLLGGGSGTTYSAGYGIDLTNDTISLKTDIFSSGNCINISRNDNKITFSFAVTAGITDIELVESLPTEPISTVLYLIKEQR